MNRNDRKTLRNPVATAAPSESELAAAQALGERELTALHAPSERFRDSFLEGAREFDAEGQLDSTYATSLGYELDSLGTNFHTFVWDLANLGNCSRLLESGYQDRIFWLLDGDEYIGQTSIRPELGTPYLITYGGHIGYSIRPGRRRQGYGTRILALALEKCAETMDCVLVTCDADNLPSRRIIEANGGDYESSLVMDAAIRRAEGRGADEDVSKLRYWIDLSGLRRHGL
ncbi:MAG: GNAT family N-acetyltransferase [Candidatus Latescibacterota bacterium]|nr:GNAT family N-acetyltransferase [Candidatus Latescibacterota bacterium]